MTDRDSGSGSGSSGVFDVLDRMDRLEELLETMTELGISTRAEAEAMLAELERGVGERDEA